MTGQMTSSGQSDSDSQVETVAIVHGVCSETTFRRNGDLEIFIKPQLDGEDEFAITLDELGTALRVLGFNRADLFPNG